MKTSNIVPKLRFPEFKSHEIEFKNGNDLFEIWNERVQKNISNLPVLAISQQFGAIPREKIDYNVIVSNESLKNYKKVQIGDFIISLRRFQGGIEYSAYNGICSPAYIILRSKVQLCNFYYKFYFKTENYIKELTRNLEGIRDGKMISYGQFSEVKLPYPTQQEQQKIADCLASLDELLDLEEKKLSALQKYKKGLLQKLFPQGESRVPEWRFPEFQNRGEWEEKLLNDCCKTYSGGTPSTSNKEFYIGEIPFIRSAEINKSITELFISENGLKNSSAKLVKKGDILIALYGANSGDIAISKINGAINQAILCVSHLTSNKFIYYCLLQLMPNVVTRCIQGGQGNLSGEIIKFIKLLFPPLQEQQKIANFLSSVDELIEKQEQKIKQYKQHKKGLLQGLFPNINGVGDVN